MIFPDLSCTPQLSFKYFEDHGIFQMLDVNAATVFTISKKSNRIHFDSDYELHLRNLSEVKVYISEHIEELSLIENYDMISYNSMYLIINQISDFETHSVYSAFVSSSPLSENDALWCFRFTQLFYDRTLLQNELLQDTNFLNNIFNSTESSIIVFDLNLRVVSYNPAAKNLFKITDPPTEDNTLKNNKVLMNALHNLVISGEKQSCPNVSFSFQDYHLLLNCVFSPLRNSKNDIVGIVAVCADITKEEALKVTVDGLRQYSILGEVAYGLAHDIKNPLSAIQGTAGVLKNPKIDTNLCLHLSNIISHEASSIDQTLTQMLSFGKIATCDDAQVVNINDSILNCIETIRRRKREKSIVITTDLSHEVNTASMNRHHLEQILLGILINSVQAIETEGNIHVVSERKNNINFISISDDGCGISEENRSKIFTPYCSTKINAKGLSLFTAKQLIESYGGNIFFTDNAEKVTKFIIMLPK